jgi:cell division protein FtsB
MSGKVVLRRLNLPFLATAFVLLSIVLLFAFFVLTPKLKSYRNLLVQQEKQSAELSKVQLRYDRLYEHLRSLQSGQKELLRAYEKPFDAKRFIAENRKHFSSLEAKRVSPAMGGGAFVHYEISALSRMGSPKDFYDFLEGLKSSGWIAGVYEPIVFEREGEQIRSTFRMRVFSREGKL